MTLPGALIFAGYGALITRESDKHAQDWPWRLTAPLDGPAQDAIAQGLCSLRPGQMFEVPGLERKSHDGRWLRAGLMSHQAKAIDWVVISG
jgi:hypothetical protein